MRLLDCSKCGGPLPTGRNCCPHCHCSTPAWKRWAIAATAAASLGAGCHAEKDQFESDFAYGLVVADFSPQDATAVVDAAPDALTDHDGGNDDGGAK